jgi:hypothetical protein
MSEDVMFLYFIILVLVCAVVLMNNRHLDEMKKLQEKLIHQEQFGDMTTTI